MKVGGGEFLFLLSRGSPTERPAFEDPAVLMREMKSTGLSLTRRVLGRANDPTAANQVSVGMLRRLCAVFFFD